MGIFTKRIDKHYDERSGAAGVVPPSRSNVSFGIHDTLGLTAVYRCVSIIEASGSQLPMVITRQGEIIDSPLADKPDINLTASEFWGQTLVSLALHGNAYWYVSRKQDGTPQNLVVIDPKRVGIEQPSDKIGATYHYYVGGVRVPRKNIQHLRLFSLPEERLGLGPIQAARRDLETALRIRAYGDDFLSSGAIPTGVLSSDQFLNQEQANAYRDAWNAAQESRGLAVLGSGMKYDAISLTPADIQFLESKQYSTMEIARLFGIPPVYLGLGMEGSSLTYATTETLSILFLQTTLTAYIQTIEEHFTDLLPRGQKARFKLDALMRADLNTRVNAYEKLVGLGAMSPEEVRRSEGMSPTIWTAAKDGSLPSQENDGAPL